MHLVPHPRCRKEISSKEGSVKDSKYISVEVERRLVDSVALLNKKRRSCAVPRTAAHDREFRV